MYVNPKFGSLDFVNITFERIDNMKEKENFPPGRKKKSRKVLVLDWKESWGR